MENKKFETLIDLIINENEEQARELFHEIVVEKSREIYESIMDEEMMDEDGMVGQVGDLMDEITAEESGVAEGEDDAEEHPVADDSEESEEEVFDLETSDDEGEEAASEEVEDAVIRIEDKLDELMAEFEEIMAGKEGEEEMGDEEEAAGEEEEAAGEEEVASGEEEAAMMEAVELQKVSVSHGDNGAYTKSPNTNNSGQAGMDSKPVKFSGDSETVPTSPKGPSNFYSKGGTEVKGAGSFKNAPGQKGQDLEKAPKPVTAQASGVNTKSVVESRKTTKKIVK